MGSQQTEYVKYALLENDNVLTWSCVFLLNFSCTSVTTLFADASNYATKIPKLVPNDMHNLKNRTIWTIFFFN